MNGAVLVAIAATVGNLLQGWDNATIAGLAVTLVPLYISETAPTEIRGLAVKYSSTVDRLRWNVLGMIFGMSLSFSPSWRLMLSVPSLVFFALAVLYLPE